MKKALFTCLLALVMGIVLKANAQSLGFSNLKVPQVLHVETPFPTRPNTKKFVVNMEFDLTYGSADKVVNIHLFLESDYLSITGNKKFVSCNDLQANGIPDKQELGIQVDQQGKSFLDLVIDNANGHGQQGVSTSVNLIQSYVNNVDVALTSLANSPSITVTKTFTGINNTDHFVINNLVLYINNYTPNTIPIRAIVWSSNGTNNNVNNATCHLPFYLNDPVITGSIPCGLLRQFMFHAKFVDPISQNVKYEAILDMNGNGMIDADEPVVNSGEILRNLSSNTYQSPLLSIPDPYATAYEYADKKIIIIIKGGPYVTGGIPQTLDIEPCGVLPVDFKSFNAYRNKQKNEQILLKWEVATEQNNKGFYVQRKTNGEWQSIAFVPTKAPGGNSNATINYEYADQNITKNVTQYRLLQVDLDNKSSFSAVRTVLGTDQIASVLIYPNPSLNGKVNLVFNTQNSIKDVVVCDMTGRVVKYYPQVSNNNLSIEDLKAGIYTIKITDRSTSVSSVEKVVIK